METLTKLFQNMTYPTMFFIGVSVRLIIGMRQFNRRGLGGLQHFKNYFVGLITLAIEWVLKCIASIMMLWGLAGWLLK